MPKRARATPLFKNWPRKKQKTKRTDKEKIYKAFAPEYRKRVAKNYEEGWHGLSPAAVPSPLPTVLATESISTSSKRRRRPKEVLQKIRKLREAKKKNIAKRRALLEYYRVLVGELRTYQPPKVRAKKQKQAPSAPAAPFDFLSFNDPYGLS